MARFNVQHHSYIVLRNQQNSDTDFCRGALVELRDGSHHCHTHGPYQNLRYTEIADSDLGPLNEEQCVILENIFQLDVRYTVYSIPGLLEWGVGLKVGDIVLAQLPDRSSGRGSSPGGMQYTTAIIRWIGMPGSLHGLHRFGVEIMVSVWLALSGHQALFLCMRGGASYAGEREPGDEARFSV